MQGLRRVLRSGWRVLSIGLGAVFGLVIFCMCAGASWNAISDARDGRRFAPPGRLIDVGGGVRLHLNCTGPNRGQGSPTVILESGWGMPGLSWVLVQPELAKGRRVCSYDRVGRGYSDSDPALESRPRTQGEIAEQLHTLLMAAGERGPFVLVGHSHGGLMARCYYNRYPQEVAGLVLVDSSTEDMDHRFAAAAGESDSQSSGSAQVPWTGEPLGKRVLMRLVYFTGLVRWKGRAQVASGNAFHLSPAIIDEMLFLINQPRWFAISMAEANGADASYAELRQRHDLGSLPLVVLTSKNFTPNGPYSDEIVRKMRAAWVGEIQPPLARLSTRGRHVFADSGHLIPFEAPSAIVQAVEQVLAMISS